MNPANLISTMKRAAMWTVGISLAATLALSAQRKLAWGMYEGEMNLGDAMARCKSKSMRLPTRAELLAAQKDGANLTWDQNRNNYYWSSTIAGGANTCVHMDIGVTSFSGRNDLCFVRCVQ